MLLGCYEWKSYVGPDKGFLIPKVVIISYSLVQTYVFGARMKHLTEMFLLSTHNICFG